MLKGYLKCTDINKLLLAYIHFELSKREMSKVALHLRNCPICMEKYTKIQKRKTDLKRKMYEIEKKLRMQKEISAYMDKEGSDDTNFIIEGMLLSDSNYKKELIENEELRQILMNSKKIAQNNFQTNYTDEIIGILRRKKAAKLISYRKITRLFEPLLHVFAKFV